MIGPLQIESLRGIRFGWLADMAGLSILVGSNGCGKSTILDALHIVAHPRPSEALSAIVPPMGNDGGLIRGGSQSARVWLRCVDRSVKIFHPKAAWSGPGIGKVFSMSPFREVVRWPAPRGGADGDLTGLYAMASAMDRHRVVEEAVRTALPGCVGTAIHPDHGRSMLCAMLPCGPVPIVDCGRGLHAVARLLLLLAVAGDDALVLLDDPDAHVHRNALPPLAAAVRSAVARGVMVVLTTQRADTLSSLCDAYEDDPDSFAVFRLVLQADSHQYAHRTPGAEAIVALRNGLFLT